MPRLDFIEQDCSLHTHTTLWSPHLPRPPTDHSMYRIFRSISRTLLNIQNSPKKGGGVAAYTPLIVLTVINRADACISWQKHGGGGGAACTPENTVHVVSVAFPWLLCFRGYFVFEYQYQYFTRILPHVWLPRFQMGRMRIRCATGPTTYSV